VDTIPQDSLNIDLKIANLIMCSPGSYAIWIAKIGEEPNLATDVQQWQVDPKPEPKPADVIDFAARKSEQAARASAEHDAHKSEKEPDVKINDDGEDFAAGVRNPDELPESDDEVEGEQPGEDASEEQAPSTEPNEPVIAEFLSAINNYAKMATEGMPNPVWGANTDPEGL
jgi:hypothetical protein